ncbi:hypothetical protein L5D93_25095 [Paenibacillus thiaminolyticus]|nr:hypothetical protein [Paenibacillus thiaminolyticus]
MEGIPVYGTVSIGTIDLREPMLGGATEHSLKVGKEGGTGTGWLALQAMCLTRQRSRTFGRPFYRLDELRDRR